VYLLTFGKVQKCKVHYTHFTSCKSAIGGSPLSLTSLFPPKAMFGRNPFFTKIRSSLDPASNKTRINFLFITECFLEDLLSDFVTRTVFLLRFAGSSLLCWIRVYLHNCNNSSYFTCFFYNVVNVRNTCPVQ